MEGAKTKGVGGGLCREVSGHPRWASCWWDNGTPGGSMRRLTAAR